MKRAIIPLLLLLFTFSIQQISLVAKEFNQKSVLESYIFINSDPLGAEVIINNDASKGLRTPCLVRNFNKNTPPVVKLRKDGYKDYTISPTQLKETSINIDLTPISFDLFFPNETIFKINNTLTKGPLIISKLKSGTYNFLISKNKIVFKKVSGFTIAEAVLITATVLSTAWLIASAVMIGVIYQQRDASVGNSYDFNYYTRLYNEYIPVLGVSAGVTGALVIAFSSVVISDAVLRFKNKKTKFEVINTTSHDATFFETSNIFLGQGDIEKSTKILQIFLTAYPDSKLLPEVYFQLGQNYFIEGDYEQALKYWHIFKTKYPLMKYYDYVTKNIADIYYQNKEYKDALDELEKILYVKQTSDKGVSITQNIEEITAYKAKLNKILYESTKDMEYFTAADNYYLSLIDTFSDSEILDVYFGKLIDLYKMAKKQDKLNLLKQKAETLNTKNDKIKKIILSYF